MTFDPSFILAQLPAVLEAAAVTASIWAASAVLGIAAGFGIALARRFGARPVDLALKLLVEVVRGSPFLVQLFLLYYGVIDFFIGFVAGVKAFTAAVLGGIGSLPGAVLGGLAIGLIETFWSAYFSVQYKDVAAFSILVLVLIFMPTGLLGRSDVEKV